MDYKIIKKDPKDSSCLTIVGSDGADGICELVTIKGPMSYIAAGAFIQAKGKLSMVLDFIFIAVAHEL